MAKFDEKRDLRIQVRMQIFRKMSQNVLNRVLTVPQYSTRRELSGTTLKFSKVLCASSYGHFIARKEFWTQCHILPLLHYHDKTSHAQAGTLKDRWGGRCLRPIKSLRIDLMDRSSRLSL